MSASLWGCELKYDGIWRDRPDQASASLWGCELKYKKPCILWVDLQSASLWGCELKYPALTSLLTKGRQPPCEAVSWNIKSLKLLADTVVSLLVRLWVEINRILRETRKQKLSASLWGCELKYWKRWYAILSPGQPPCEAVSWNVCAAAEPYGRFRQPPCEAVSWNRATGKWRTGLAVSLLVRLWVEILTGRIIEEHSAVSLLVRLWVEILEYCQPTPTGGVSLLVRLWVEMYRNSYRLHLETCQPPCEAVSWNVFT